MCEPEPMLHSNVADIHGLMWCPPIFRYPNARQCKITTTIVIELVIFNRLFLYTDLTKYQLESILNILIE